MKHTFRALAGREFRYYFFGQLVSLAGTWIQQVAMSWIAYRVTGSAFMLGLVAFAGQIPMLLAMPLGGVLADHFSKRTILLWTQFVELAVAMSLTLVALNSGFNEWILIAASLVLGVSAAIEMPSRQSIIKELIHEHDMLGNAIALNALTFNSARLLGPALAGLILAVFSEPMCFALNALSYGAAIYSLCVIRPQSQQTDGRKGSLPEALAYLRDYAPARWLVLTVAITSLSISPFMTFMPVYAKDYFQGGPDMLGVLLSASGFGTLVAALYLANRKTTVGQGDVITFACLVGGLASIVFAYNTLLSLALPMLFLSGAGFIMAVTSCNILLQSMVEEHLRGRVMALYTMSFIGMLPIGSLVYGWLAHQLGSVKPIFVIAGLISLAWGCKLMRVIPELRRQRQRERAGFVDDEAELTGG